jgi:diguanylate cyclase (GGDEF)-like protein/PAS domain S-box-containing protein
MTGSYDFGGVRLDQVERFSQAVTGGVAGATVIVFDRDLRILVADGAAYGRHGTRAESLIGRQIVDVVPADAWRRLKGHYEAALRGERSSFEYRASDGLGCYWLHLSPFQDELGEIVGGVLVSQDITERLERDEERRMEVEHTTAAFADAPIGMAALAMDGKFIRVNPALCRMIGRTAEELVGTDYRELIHPDDLDESAADLIALRSGKSTHESERRYFRADGSEAWALVSTTPLRSVGDRPPVLFVQVQDATLRRRAEENLRRRLRQQSAVAELGIRALAGGDLGELIEAACEEMARALDVELTSYLEARPGENELMLRAGTGWERGDVGRLLVPAGRRSLGGYALQSRQAVVTHDLREEKRFAARILCGRGVISSVSTVVGGPDRALGVLGVHAREPLAFTSEDVHFVQAMANVLAETIERREAEERTRHQACHDPLTDLPNRPHFVSRLSEALEASATRGVHPAVFLVDIDDFKAVNDSLGHEAGDALLCAIASRLREVVRDGDLIARFGADEFAVLSPTLRSHDQVHEVAERLLAAFTRPFEVGEETHYAQASVGACVAADSSRAPEDMLREADAAMYRAKDRGRNRYELLTEAVVAKTVDRLRIHNELRRALAGGELRVCYQPFFNLGDPVLVGAEALVRWQHPERGLLGPGEFLPVAEESGLVVALGEWVLREACTQAARWSSRLGSAPFLLTVNVAARQFATSTLPDVVRDALSRSGLPPEALGLEVTEGALADAHADPEAALHALKEVGVRLLLDDFGKGFSSLGRLKRLPIDVVKIDRTFVDQVAHPESHDSAIVAAIMGMARALEMDVIAEGVETEEQMASLRGLGCGVAQGFLLGRPLPASDIDALVDGTAA